MKMTVISPGLLSTVQDGGRFGYMSRGFSPSGAMDGYSMKLANLLVGNDRSDGVIEMTLLGASLRFDCTSVIAVTGADMEPEINGQPIKSYTAVQVNDGDTLTFKAAKSGLRSYLAVAGGFDLPYVMGSMSTNLKCAIGGVEGRRLKAGDEIPLRRSVPLSAIGRRSVTPENEFTDCTVRMVLGPQDDHFTDSGIETFLSAEYTVSDKSDRMGVRLEGEKIENKNGVDIISDGIVTGSVQIPASGTPIIMMADRQTTGGYAKIATVITADLKKAAQAKPGSKLRFQAVSEKQAVAILRKEERKLKFLEYKFCFSVYKEI